MCVCVWGGGGGGGWGGGGVCLHSCVCVGGGGGGGGCLHSYYIGTTSQKWHHSFDEKISGENSRHQHNFQNYTCLARQIVNGFDLPEIIFDLPEISYNI